MNRSKCRAVAYRSIFFVLLFISGVTGIAQNKISFIAFGDWGRHGTHNQDEVSTQMGIWAADNKADFVISLGDNFYENGVTSVEDTLWKVTFEDIYTSNSLQIPWYALLGNHDYHDNVQAEIDYTNISSRWNMPARYYSVTRKLGDNSSALFVFMDSNPICLSDDELKLQTREDMSKIDNSLQLSWLDSTLANSDAKWKFVCAHHPIVSGGEHGGLREMLAEVYPILVKDKADVFFCGHDHDMQHLVMDNMNFFVSGAGSATRNSEATKFTKFFAAKTSGFLGVTLSSGVMNASFIDKDGNVLYSTAISK